MLVFRSNVRNSSGFLEGRIRWFLIRVLTSSRPAMSSMEASVTLAGSNFILPKGEKNGSSSSYISQSKSDMGKSIDSNSPICR